jgi:hypothetical protein
MNTQKKLTAIAVAALLVSGLFIYLNTAFAAKKAAIYSCRKDGTPVNENIYGFKSDVYLSGGPQNNTGAGLPDGTYYFQITDPNGKILLSTDPAVCRQLTVSSGRVAGSTGPPCKHMNGTFNPPNGTLPVQMIPFDNTPNNGTVYEAWVVPVGKATIVGPPATSKVLRFSKSDAKTDNFKVQAEQVITGECQPSSSMSVLVQGTKVIAYVPKGNWSIFPPTPGVSVVGVENDSTSAVVPTSDTINSCASNAITGKTVCTANNAQVYVLTGTALDSTVVPNPLTSSGSGTIFFSGGACTNCGVMMDATHNKAAIGLAFSPGVGGFQFLNLAGTVTNSSFESSFASMNLSGEISEDPLIDPIRNLLSSPSEDNNYEIVNVTTSTSPTFFERFIPPTTCCVADSAGEDCSTGIVLAPYEFSEPSEVFVGDLTSAVFTAGSPGSWTSLSSVNTLTESFLAAGASGVAVAQGTHTGVVSGEFGGDAVTAIQLPPTSGVVTLPDWITCNIGGGFSNGNDPHTVTAYMSPTSGHAIALLANGGFSPPTMLAVVDLTNMLALARTGGGHGCAAGTLTSSEVTFISLP